MQTEGEVCPLQMRPPVVCTGGEQAHCLQIQGKVCALQSYPMSGVKRWPTTVFIMYLRCELCRIVSDIPMLPHAGESVAKYIREPSPFNTQIVSLGVDTYLKMLLADNFVHTDLHPGNIMVRIRGVRITCCLGPPLPRPQSPHAHDHND